MNEQKEEAKPQNENSIADLEPACEVSGGSTVSPGTLILSTANTYEGATQGRGAFVISTDKIGPS